MAIVACFKALEARANYVVARNVATNIAQREKDAMLRIGSAVLSLMNVRNLPAQAGNVSYTTAAGPSKIVFIHELYSAWWDWARLAILTCRTVIVWSLTP